MSKRMTKAGFKAYLKRTKTPARCGSPSSCVIANYLRSELGYRNPKVYDGYTDWSVAGTEPPKALPWWAKRVMNKFDALELNDPASLNILRAAQYRKPLLAVL